MVNIDINNYPVLGSMLERFKEYEPDIKMYLRNVPIYNGEQKTNEEKLTDFNKVIKLYSDALVKREYFCDPQLIAALSSERTSQSVTIQIFKLSDIPFITWYNIQVLKKVQEYCETILSTISNEYDFLFTGEKESELNLIGSFQKYYKLFYVDSNSLNNPIQNINVSGVEKIDGSTEINNKTEDFVKLHERVEGIKKVNDLNMFMLPNEPVKKVDPLSYINPSIVSLFLSAEKKALGVNDTFPNKIRCAAFCEILYDRKYIIQSKQNQKQMRDFALARYHLNISNALLSVKQDARNKHKNFTVDGMPPLKNFF